MNMDIFELLNFPHPVMFSVSGARTGLRESCYCTKNAFHHIHNFTQLRIISIHSIIFSISTHPIFPNKERKMATFD